ncbi:MAG: methionyl-tRNA formyltransferase [Peptococcaceae bacterium]|nr:methionyl-tRNA formyltransferase [Peptococcaceae bacterium]
MNVIFMGTPDFAVPSLKALVDSGISVINVITQPDRPKGRGKKILPSPVKEAALEMGIPVFQPERVREPEFIDIIRSIKPDLIVVVAFGQILPKALLDLPKLGCINVHASVLPKYRGAAPIQRAIMNGEMETGISIMKMDQGLDTGDILIQETTAILPEDSFGSLHDRLSVIGAKLLIDTVTQMECKKLESIPQDNDNTTYASPINQEDQIINWGNSAVGVKNIIRSLDPWPGAKTTLEDKVLKIWRARVLEDAEVVGRGIVFEQKNSGVVINIDNNRLIVQCREGFLELLEIQLEGSKRMRVSSYLRGKNVESGVRLG